MIKQIISEHKKIPKNKPVTFGYKRVEAIIEENGNLYTKHLDIKKGE